MVIADVLMGVSSSSSGIMSSPVRPSNVTNRRDAESVASRVFIGNLNTALVSKRHVAAVFSAYGRVLGCSVHKGFAFVQYASRGHARAAVSGHDGRVLAGQALDVNMAGEAKPDPDLPGASFYLQLRTDLDRRLFDFHGRAPPPVVRGAPPLVKWPRASSLPARLRPQNVNVLHAKATAGRRVQLQVIKSQLTQIKANVDALLGRLEHIAERAHARDAGSSNGHQNPVPPQLSDGADPIMHYKKNSKPCRNPKGFPLELCSRRLNPCSARTCIADGRSVCSWINFPRTDRGASLNCGPILP